MRKLSEIGSEIKADWKSPFFGATPYLTAMCTMNSISDQYGWESGKSIVIYFLCNAQTWRGPVARRIKAELKEMIK